MFRRMFRGLALLCLLVILVSGSPQIYSGNQQERNRRHAACPSCSRDCPDALANWYTPSGKEFRGLGQQVSPSAIVQPYQPSLSFYSSPSPYDGALGSRGTPFEGGRDTSKRENPFAYQRRFHSDVASAPPTPFYGTRSSVTSYQSPVDRALGRTPYQRSSFYDMVRPQSNLVPADAYSSYQSPKNIPSIESIKSPYEDSRKVQVVYRADQYPEDLVKQNVNVPVEYPRGHMYGGRSTADLQGTVGCGCQQSKAGQLRDSPIVYPQITTVNSNAYQSQRGQDLQRDSLKNVNYNSRYQMQPVVTDPGVNVYQNQRGQQLDRDLSTSINYNPQYQVQPVDADEVNGNAYQQYGGQNMDGDSYISVNYNPRYQPRAIKIANNSDQDGDEHDSQQDVQEESKGKRNTVREQGISKKAEKSANASTERVPEKVTESAPQESRIRVSTERTIA